MDINQINRVYSGKPGKCCCGCSGKYSDSDRSKKLILNKILKADYEDCGDHVWAEVGNRLYIAYKN